MSVHNWITKEFNELKLEELYAILHLRSEVFVIEQDCIYQDLDYYDQKAWHLMAFEGNKLVAYARIFKPHVKYKEAAIGRVITHSSVRGSGIGKALMKKGIAFCESNFPNENIKISAQCYLERFYTSLGFKIVSKVYLEDGIEHQEMTYVVNA